MFAHCKFSLFLFKVVTRVLTVLLSFLISTFWFSLRSFPVAIQLSGNHSKKKKTVQKIITMSQTREFFLLKTSLEFKVSKEIYKSKKGYET